MEQLANDSYEKHALNYFDFISWLVRSGTGLSLPRCEVNSSRIISGFDNSMTV